MLDNLDIEATRRSFFPIHSRHNSSFFTHADINWTNILVDQGRLRTSDKIADLLPDELIYSLGPRGLVKSITIAQILSHTAGLSVWGFGGYGPDDGTPSASDVIIGESPVNSLPVKLVGLPGKGWSYSGGGYTLVQIALEKLTNPLADLAVICAVCYNGEVLLGVGDGCERLDRLSIEVTERNRRGWVDWCAEAAVECSAVYRRLRHLLRTAKELLLRKLDVWCDLLSKNVGFLSVSDADYGFSRLLATYGRTQSCWQSRRAARQSRGDPLEGNAHQ